MKLARRATGAVAILTGVLLFVVACAVYLVVTRVRGHGDPMAVSLGVPSPIVVIAPAQVSAIQSCVTPRKMGQRTQVQLNGEDILDTPRSLADIVLPACAGTAIGVSPLAMTPGINRLTYTALYSGRYERRVGVSVAAGPFDDRERWISCAARIWIGQDFLDAPGGSTDDLADTIESMLRRRRFHERCMTGSVVDSHVRVAWIKSGLALSAMMRLDTGDVIRIKGELKLSSRDGRLDISFLPSSLEASLVGPAIFCERGRYAKNHPFISRLFVVAIAGEIHTKAHEQVHDSAVRMIERELLGPVRALLESPHPLHLVDSPEALLDVRFGDLDIEPDQGALLCVDLRAITGPHAERMLPGPLKTAYTPLPAQRDRTQRLRIDLSLQAMNAALDAAWRVKLLDRLLAKSSDLWADLFKNLTVLPIAMAFELPPVIQPGQTGPEITVGDLRVWLADCERPEQVTRVADLWARVDLGARYVQADNNVQLTAQLRDFGLTCQLGRPGEEHLDPCYSDAVQMLENSLLNQPIATNAVGTIMVPVEKWLPGDTDSKATFVLDLEQAELRPLAGGNWYQLFADVRVRVAPKH